ncbi:carbonic anhydrase [Agilicoccus flavus]|uniref:carbonic anhydrase n=1 Tax=Agilicoccus flavus TaxID=2775968 RepID=UPI001CF6CBFD|nr:carbonic anhydrase [Agilicoccus flavus]
MRARRDHQVAAGRRVPAGDRRASECDGPPPGGFDALTHRLEAAGPALADDVAAVRAVTADLDEMWQANVRLQVEHLRAHPVVADALGRHAVRLLGLHFDIATATTHTVVGAPEPVTT